jgi:WD40 repeat protein
LLTSRIIVTGDFIFSSSYDKTAKAWLFDTSNIDEREEEKACVRTFKGHGKGVYPLIFIPAEDFDPNDGATINPGDILLTGSADTCARSWSFDTGNCLKVKCVAFQEPKLIHISSDLQGARRCSHLYVDRCHGQVPVHRQCGLYCQVLEHCQWATH